MMRAPDAACLPECICAKRFVLHENIADQFLEKFTAAMTAAKIGDPLDESTRLGPCRPPRR